MIKRELEEIKELERYIEKITYEEEVISQLKQDFYHNSEGFARGQIEANILENQQPQEKLLSFLDYFPENSYEELEQIDNYITMIQDGSKDYELLKQKYRNERQSIINSGIKTDCIRTITQELDEKNLSNPVVQVLLGKFEKQGEAKPLHTLLDTAFSQLQKIKDTQIPRYKASKIIEMDLLMKTKLKDMVNLLENMDQILPSVDEIN